MIDLSDGLGGDARHLAEASGVACGSTPRRCRSPPGVAEVAAALGRDPLQLAVSGGEDYELLAAFPPQALDLARLGEEAGVALTRIGEVVAGEGVEIRLPGGRTLEPSGFDQLGLSVGTVGEQLADATTPEHRLGDERRLGPVAAAFDKRFEPLLLHGSPIGHGRRDP